MKPHQNIGEILSKIPDGLIHPKLQNYNGLILRGDVNDYDVIDSWIETGLRPSEVESILNKIQIWDEIDVPEDLSDAVLAYCTKELRNYLVKFDRNFSVLSENSNESYGPEYTFYLIRDAL